MLCCVTYCVISCVLHTYCVLHAPCVLLLVCYSLCAVSHCCNLRCDLITCCRYRAGTCLTDRLAALHSLAASPHLLQQELEHFATTYAGRPAVLQHWLKLQASLDEPQPAGDGSTADAAAQSTGSTAGPQPGSAAAVRALLHHRAFAAADAEAWDALMSAFAGNEHSFHAADGSGYDLVADAVLQVWCGRPVLVLTD